ncbi:MAG: P1 family peptidase [Ignavibacteria bacterium]|nr:P1 family peptidase [Ignavibacteria bacterium]
MTLPPGFRIGHWTDRSSLTGCSVILCPPHTVAGCDVRGSSPGSRELALLHSEKTMQEIHALLLTGGSAFGLAAADGVMRWLEEHQLGYQTPWVRVPIVPAAVIFDLNVGSSTIRPDAESGYLACQNAAAGEIAEGSVGAGTGATVGKWNGIETRMKGGIGISSASYGDLLVSAVAVVNAVGDVLRHDGTILAGARNASGQWLGDMDPLRTLSRSRQVPLGNTTLVALATNARLSKVEVNRVAQRGHDGMARAVKPVHTSYDGDVVFGLASGIVEAGVDLVAELGSDLIAEAIRRAVLTAESLGGVPVCR